MDPLNALRLFLKNPHHYNGLGDVTLHETHGALVGVGGNIAIKVKKPVAFPYMDYSTPEKRRVLCHREMTLNQRTAPHLYREIRMIAQDAAGGLFFTSESNDTVVDYAIVMNRFDDHTLLSEQSFFSDDLCGRLAATIATFHKAEPALSGIDGYAMMVGVVMGNDGCFGAYGKALPRTQTKTLMEKCLATLGHHKDLLEKRSGTFIKQCHGDLYLKNIYVDTDGQPVLFDCIEFNDAFAQIDTGYDLAFLLMDVLYRGMSREAFLLRHLYIQKTGDVDALILLPVFMAIRAAIRSHVSVAIAQGIEDPAAKKIFLTDAQTYLDLALSLVSGKRGNVTAFGGYSGSGKTTLARAFAQKTGAVLLSSDDLRKHMHGVAVTETLPESAYTPEKSQAVYDRLYELAVALAQTGQNVVLDATFLLSSGREALAAQLEKEAIPFRGFWVEAPDDVAEASLARRVGDASDATTEIRRQQKNQNVGPLTWARLPGHGSTETILQGIAA
jgi:aminoglycoside phosphotransferase family enzyme/predicted kinase